MNKTAKEMFEELGYSIVLKWSNGFELYTQRPITQYPYFEGQLWVNRITVDLKRGLYSDKYISIEMLKAIQKQIEELGWNNE